MSRPHVSQITDAAAKVADAQTAADKVAADAAAQVPPEPSPQPAQPPR
jgi:hypothetical protein